MTNKTVTEEYDVTQRLFHKVFLTQMHVLQCQHIVNCKNFKSRTSTFNNALAAIYI